MLGPALALTLLLLLQGNRGQEIQDSAHHVVRLSGASVCLRPSSTRIKAYSVQWKVQWPSDSKCYVILTWRNTSGMEYKYGTSNHFNNRLRFSIEDLTLHIEAVQHQDSGLYFLELTNESGQVSWHKFQVSVFDHVEEPRVLGQWKALDTGKCQVTLSCLVSRGGDVSYAWYRGTELIQTSRNLTKLEVQIDINSSHTYICNVSNPVSWAENTLTLTQGCLTGHQKLGFLPFLVMVVILLVTLFLGTLTFFCVRRRKRKRSETSPEELLTIYEDVNNPRIRRNQRQKQNSPGEGTTIYSMIQSQPSASTSQETTNTLYSLVQPARKSGSKKKSHGPSFNNTVYDEVGKREPRAQNPVRLSCKELESFYMYS